MADTAGEYFSGQDIRVGGRSDHSWWEMSWMAGESEARAAAAAYRALDIVTRRAADMARAVHGWESRTGQLEEAIFQDPPLFHPVTHQMWGRWGVRDSERAPLTDNTHTGMPLTNKDVAMFLEFGTRTDPGGDPFLYPAWDATKVQLPAEFAKQYLIMRGRSRNPGNVGNRIRITHFPSLRQAISDFLGGGLVG